MNSGAYDPATALRILSQLSQEHAKYSRGDFLKRVAVLGRNLLRVPVCILWMRDKNDKLVIEAWAGTIDKDYEKTQLDPELPHLRNNRPGYLADVRKDSTFYGEQARAASNGWISLLTAPLRAGSHLVGMIDVYTTEPRVFGAVERDAFVAFANATTLYLWTQDVQAEHVIEEYTEIRAAATPVELSAKIVEWNLGRLRADFGHIRLLDNRTNDLVFTAAAARRLRRSPYEPMAQARRSVGSGMSGQVAASREPLNIPDVRSDTRFQQLRESLVVLKQRSSAYERFFVEALTERTISVQGSRTPPWALVTIWGTEPDVLPSVSVVECASLFRETIRSLVSSQPLSLDHLGNLLSEAQAVERRLAKFLQDATDVFHGYGAQFHLFDRRKRSLAYIDGLGPIASYAARHRIRSLGTDNFSQACQRGRRILVLDLREDPHFKRLGEQYMREVQAAPQHRSQAFEDYLRFARSEMTAPLQLSKGGPIGCATLTTREPILDDGAAADFQDMLAQLARDFTDAARRCEVGVRDLVAVLIGFREALSHGLKLLVNKQPPAAMAHAWLIDRSRGQLQPVAAAGLPIDTAPRAIQSVPEYGDVINSGTYFEVSNLRRDRAFASRRAKHDASKTQIADYEAYLDSVKSSLIVPLLAEGRLIGTATMQSKEAGFFGDTDLRLFENSMKYAAELIAQVQMSEASRLLQEEMKKAWQPHRLARLLRQVSRSAIQMVGADIVAIYQYDHAEGTFMRPAVIEGVLIRPVATSREILNAWIPERMLKQRRDYIAEDAAQISSQITLPPDFGGRRKNFVARERIKSAAGFVLEAGGEPLGVMFFNFRNRQRFSSSRTQLMRMFASEASIAIQNARMYRSIQVRGSGEQTMEALESGLKRVIANACGNLNADAGHIRLYDPEMGSLTRAVLYGDVSPARQVIGRGQGLSGALLDNPVPIIIPDLSTSDYRHRKDWFRDPASLSFACLPLLSGDRILGTLFLSATGAGTFTADSLPFLESYAEQAVKVIREHGDRLNRSTKEERLQELEQLLEGLRLTLNQAVTLCLTAITMEGGLEFNRALVFLRGKGDSQLVCEYGIFPRDKADAVRVYKEWTALTERMSKPTLQNLIALDGGISALERSLKLRVVPPEREGVWGPESGEETTQALAKAYNSHTSFIGSLDNVHQDDFLRSLEAPEFALVPLTTGGHTIGVLYVDNKYTTPAKAITDADVGLLRLYADRLATVINRFRHSGLDLGADSDTVISQAVAGEVAAALSHQLAPILAGVHTNLLHLENDDKLSQGARDLYGKALDQTMRAKQVVVYWRLLGERGTNRIVPFLKTWQVGDVLEKLGITVSGRLRELGVTEPKVTVGHPGAPATVRVYLEQLQVDFENFAKDSLRVKGPGLLVKVTAERAMAHELKNARLPTDRSFVKITYQDNGPGVSNVIKDRIFDFRFSGSGGSGVGLALARWNAKDHGGFLIESGKYTEGGGPGSGARFDLFLPIDS